MVAYFVKVLDVTELFTIKWYIVWYVFHLHIEKAKTKTTHIQSFQVPSFPGYGLIK